MAKRSSRGGGRELSDNSTSKKSDVRRNGHAPRRAAAGDTAPVLGSESIEQFQVAESISGAQEFEVEAVRDIVNSTAPHDVASLARSLQAIMKGSSPDDAAMLRKALSHGPAVSPDRRPANPDTDLAPDWREGGYPYKNLLSRKSYEKQKYHLQVELLKMQAWVKAEKKKVVILFEGATPPAREEPSNASWNILIHAGPGSSRSERPATWSAGSGISSDTFSICPPPVRSSCSTDHGTTAQASSM